MIVSALITLHQKHHLKRCPEFLHPFLLNLLQAKDQLPSQGKQVLGIAGLSVKSSCSPFPASQRVNIRIQSSQRESGISWPPAGHSVSLPPLVTPVPWVLQMSYSMCPVVLLLLALPSPTSQIHSATLLSPLGTTAVEVWKVSHPRDKRHSVPLRRRESSWGHFPAAGQRIHHIWP